MPGLSVVALALMRGDERFNAPERALPPTWTLALATGLPAAKAACEFTLFRWTEVQFPLLKQGAPTWRAETQRQKSRQDAGVTEVPRCP
jgi:hypothetical protein